MATKLIYATGPRGTFGPGVYVADADEEDRRGAGCPTNALDVATRFQIQSPTDIRPDKATNWVEFAITRANYYLLKTGVNSAGQREIVVVAPLLPLVKPWPPFEPASALYIGDYAFGIEFVDACL